VCSAAAGHPGTDHHHCGNSIRTQGLVQWRPAECAPGCLTSSRCSHRVTGSPANASARLSAWPGSQQRQGISSAHSAARRAPLPDPNACTVGGLPRRAAPRSPSTLTPLRWGAFHAGLHPDLPHGAVRGGAVPLPPGHLGGPLRTPPGARVGCRRRPRHLPVARHVLQGTPAPSHMPCPSWREGEGHRAGRAVCM
jgi:hypothetical protein